MSEKYIPTDINCVFMMFRLNNKLKVKIKTKLYLSNCIVLHLEYMMI